MKTNELRIGNIIKLRDTGEIVRVCGYAVTHVMVEVYGGMMITPIDRIEGVLIYDHWQKIESGIVEWDDKNEDEMQYFYTPLGYDRTFRYIHELQNLHYALTGEELKIEI